MTLGLGVIFVIFLFSITKNREPCQYQLLTPCDYVWCRGQVAKVQGSGASDPGSIPGQIFLM